MPVQLAKHGLEIDGVAVPLLAGAVHYWRLDPHDWRAALEAVRGVGCRLVDVYVPWAVHERGPGQLDLGEVEPRHDVAAFLRLAQEVGLYAILRPGPHINAELTFFGIPERVVWDPRCQARTPRGNPVMLPAPPRMFPVPSYASEAFRDEVTRYYELLGRALAPLRWPDGPIVLVQVDNEGALYFRDGAYDQDYHPDALGRFREFLREKYGLVAELTRVYGGAEVAGPMDAPTEGSGSGPPDTITARGGTAEPIGLMAFADVSPPERFEAASTDDLARYLDWAEFHEQLLADTFAHFRRALESAGLGGVPTVHNFPPAQETTPLNAARVVEVVDFVGLDYYGKASESARRDIARRTSELASHASHRGFPAFACEMGAGYPPIFPPLEERDSLFTAMCALAYGLRGYNLYMAVDRDRWLGAPIDAHGRRRPFAEAWERLARGLNACGFWHLRRRVPVRLVMPRSERRLARVMHAFGPVSGAVLAVMGKGIREGCLEDDLGLGYPVAIEADALLRSFEEALEGRGVPYAFVGGELRRAGLDEAQWIVCATSGGLHGDLVGELQAATARGARVTVGPHFPRFDGAWKACDWGSSLSSFDVMTRHDPATVDSMVAEVVEALDLPRLACDPSFVHTTVHEDVEGHPRAAFVINATDEDALAHCSLGVDAVWADVMSGADVTSRGGSAELRVRRKSVRLLVRR